MTTHNHLPPSNAGIGKILNTARAKDINALNAKILIHKPFSNKISTLFTAATGQDKLFNSFFTVFALQEKKLAQRSQSFDNVIFP
jgi:hypothetical protein